MKLRDIWGRAVSPFKKLTRRGTTEVAAEFAERIERRDNRVQAATTKISEIKRYSWVSVGLNRHERRTLDSQLKHGAVPRATRGRVQEKRTALDKVGRGFAKFQLTNSPRNSPVHRGFTNNPLYWRGLRSAQ